MHLHGSLKQSKTSLLPFLLNDVMKMLDDQRGTEQKDKRTRTSVKVSSMEKRQVRTKFTDTA